MQTVDFFTPIVDDPFDFGAIAATNALSDIYAMGAQPVSALNLVAFSLADLGADILLEILRGAASVAATAGCGDPGRPLDRGRRAQVRNGGDRRRAPRRGPDQRSGTGRGRTRADQAARRRDGVNGLEARVPGASLAEAVAVMTTLNREASVAARAAGAHALTDVTGFGLLGHLHELALASGVAAVVEAAVVPAIDGVLELLADPSAVAVAGGTRRNRDHASRVRDV